MHSTQAPERLDVQNLSSVDLSDRVWAISIDDCEFQRMVLSCIFMQLGLPNELVTVLGATDDEMKAARDRIVQAGDAQLLYSSTARLLYYTTLLYYVLYYSTAVLYYLSQAGNELLL